MPLFVIFRPVRKKLQLTVSFDHPVADSIPISDNRGLYSDRTTGSFVTASSAVLFKGNRIELPSCVVEIVSK